MTYFSGCFVALIMAVYFTCKQYYEGKDITLGIIICIILFNVVVSLHDNGCLFHMQTILPLV